MSVDFCVQLSGIFPNNNRLVFASSNYYLSAYGSADTSDSKHAWTASQPESGFHVFFHVSGPCLYTKSIRWLYSSETLLPETLCIPFNDVITCSEAVGGGVSTSLAYAVVGVKRIKHYRISRDARSPVYI